MSGRNGFSPESKHGRSASNLEEAQALEYAAAKQDLGLFVQSAWETLEPTTELKWNWHHDLICEYLQACEKGELQRLIINIAPRSTKSMLATICFPSWVWTRQASARFLFGSYADDLATSQSVLRRKLIESEWYQGGYSNDVQLSADENQKSAFSNTKTGAMKSMGIKGAVTGKGGDYIIIDDPHNPKGAESEADREATLRNFDLGWSSRLNDKKTGRIIVIVQRLHERDLTGHLLAKNLGYTHLKIPSIAEERQTLIFPITGRHIVRNPGDLMHPARDGIVELEQAKQDLGSYGFVGQHQQSPVPRGGGLIKEAWFKRYDRLPDKIDTMIQSWDFAVKDTAKADYSVGLVLARRGADKYVVAMYRARIDFPKQCRALVDLSLDYPATHKKLVEAKANGTAVIDTLKKQVPGLIPVEPDGDKVARMNAISPDVEAGNWHLPDPDKYPWVREFLHEVCSFPHGAHDDICDAFSQGAREFRKSGIVFAPLAGHSGR